MASAPGAGNPSMSGSYQDFQQCTRAFVNGTLFSHRHHRWCGGDQSVDNVNSSSFCSGRAERDAWNNGSIADNMICKDIMPKLQVFVDPLLQMTDEEEMAQAIISDIEKMCREGITWASVLSLLVVGLAAANRTSVDGELDRVFLSKLAYALTKAFCESNLRQWIDDNGGWNGLLQFMKRIDICWLVGTLTVASAVATVYTILRKP